MRERLLERDRFGSDHMHQRPALQTRKYGGIDQLLVLGAGEDEPATRAPQRLVRRAGHEMRDADGCGVEPGGDQTRVMRDVGHQIRTDRVRDCAKARPVDEARIRGRPGDDELWLVLMCELFGGIVIDELSRRVEPIRDHAEPLARDVDR